MPRRVLAIAVTASVLASSHPATAAASAADLANANATGAAARTEPTGGAPITGVLPRARRIPPPPGKNAHGIWLTGFTITEYWPAPERWFIGALVNAPGLRARHRVDWLYSATGVSMQGDGIGVDGRMYHIESLGAGGWVNAAGAPTFAPAWLAGPPFWRDGGYWQSRGGAVTFPLLSGGWYAGIGRRYVPLPGVTFAPGPSLPLRSYQSIAVDPGVIPLGSRVYIPAYRNDGYGGWFLAQDTGGAIQGSRIDVFRRPPTSPEDSGRYLTGRRVFVIRARR